MIANGHSPFLSARLQGLDPDKKYTIVELGKSYYEDELMNVGINIPKVRGDFTSLMWRLKAE
jgi:alpha-galactosidase